jgi:curved DNA-binding protein CbpA
MSTPLPPDPYVALGLGKDATPAQIKTTYRKLVLKCHPDKVTDESKKAEASDQFHRIQQAYEILSDEGRRSRYDAHIKMAELRKQNMSNRPPVEVRTAAYEVPTSGPGRATFTARGPERVYEERRPERSDSDDYFGNTSRTTSRKHDDYDRQAPKKTTVPLRDDKERARVVERERRDSERVSRTDKRRTRDQDVKRERDRKYVYDDESDTDLRQDAEWIGNEREKETSGKAVAATGTTTTGNDRLVEVTTHNTTRAWRTTLSMCWHILEGTNDHLFHAAPRQPPRPRHMSTAQADQHQPLCAATQPSLLPLPSHVVTAIGDPACPMIFSRPRNAVLRLDPPRYIPRYPRLLPSKSLENRPYEPRA